jgi:hypothetical protein
MSQKTLCKKACKKNQGKNAWDLPHAMILVSDIARSVVANS